MASINQVIDFDTAAIVATDFGFEPQEHGDRRDGRGAGRARLARAAPRRGAKTRRRWSEAPAGRHHPGPRRPRQDQPARRHPRGQRHRGRGRRHHPAHRRLPGRGQRPEDHLPRHARPRGLHGHARPRRPGHRHRRARRRGGRRRHAHRRIEAIEPRPRRRRADHHRRSTRSTSTAPTRTGCMQQLTQYDILVEQYGGDVPAVHGLGAHARRASTTCSRTSSWSPRSRTSRPTRTVRPSAPSSRRS